MRLALLVLLAFASQSADVELKLVPKSKAKSRQFIAEHRDIVTSERGEATESVHRTEALVELEDTEQGPVVKIVLTRCVRKNLKLDVDTDKEDPSVVAKLFKGMLSVPLRLRPGASKESDIGGLNEFGKKVIALMGGDPEAQTRFEKNIAQQILQDFSPFLVPHPDKKVTVGVSWARPITATEDYPVEGEAKWRLSHRDRGTCTIEMAAVLKPATAPSDSRHKIQFVRQLDGKLEGKVQMEESTGWPVDGAWKRTLKGKQWLLGLRGTDPTDIDTVSLTSEYTLKPLRK